MTLDKRVAIVKDVVIHPVRAFREISENGKYYLPGAIVLFLGSAIVFSTGAVEGALSLGLDIFSVVILYYIGRALKGTASFSGLFSALQYAGIPILFASGLFSFIPSSGLDNLSENISQLTTIFVIAIPLVLWGIILYILAVREAHRFGTGRAIGTIIISMIIFIIIFVVVIVGVGLSGFMGEDLFNV